MKTVYSMEAYFPITVALPFGLQESLMLAEDQIFALMYTCNINTNNSIVTFFNNAFSNKL